MNLIQQIDHFCKLAGLLKVPDKILKEAINFIVGKYCFELSLLLEKKIENFRSREVILNNILPLIEIWQEIYNHLDTIKNADKSYVDKDEVDHAINQLIQICNQNKSSVIRFPKFDPFYKAENSFNGSIGSLKEAKSLFFSLDKNEDGTFYLWFNGSYNGKTDEDSEEVLVNFDVAEENINIENLAKVISKVMPEFEKIMMAIDRIEYNYEVFTNDYINAFVMMNAYCKKFINLGPDSIHDWFRRSKKIIVTSQDLDATKSGYGAFSFIVVLTKEFVNNENYRGLWSPYTQGSGDIKDIGQVFILGNPEEDMKDYLFQSPKALKEKIDQLARTTRHEVQHMVQDFISKIHELKEDGGLPSKKIRDPRTDFHGYQSEGYEGPELLDRDDKAKRIQHRLRDTEFYNRLSDEAHDFNKIKTNFPLTFHKTLLRGWIADISYEKLVEFWAEELKKEIVKKLNKNNKHVDEYNIKKEYLLISYHFDDLLGKVYQGSYFFKGLKEYQPAKYRKAVIEFVKAVT